MSERVDEGRDESVAIRAAASDDEPWDMPILRVEVTTAAAFQMPDGTLLGSNLVDTTLVFGWRADDLPEGLTDDQINTALTRQLSPVLAVIQTALTYQGWVAMGQVDDAMTDHAHDTGKVGMSTPVTVEVRMPTTPLARA